MSRVDDLARIRAALERAKTALQPFTPGQVEHIVKSGGDPVTAADDAINDVLLASLPRDDEGWLSEETRDDRSRLERRRVWIVDPLDGTREFIAGIPEWCVSVALVEDGLPVAGGIHIPALGLDVVGALEEGVTANGEPVGVREASSLDGIEVLASRSETKRGEWERFAGAPFRVTPTGSVAFKMALVAAGRAEATWTLVPKHEWDVAGGTALVRAAGGDVWLPGGAEPTFNRERPKLPGLLACGAGLRGPISEYLRSEGAIEG